jgi:23S rRNA (uracil1939-C5)-methyltransferase
MEGAAGEGSVARKARRGDLLEVEIESLAFGGRGVARADGLVVFVAGALPGDRVRAEVTKAKKRFAEARAVELLEASADRVPDRCVHGGEPCPGAPWQGLPYERQLQIKAEQVDEALRRLGGLDGFELEEIVPAAVQWRYRNKLEYSFGELEGEPILGFHARGRWDLVVDVEDCHLASEAGNAARNEVREWARAESVPAFDGGAKSGVLRNLVVREGWRSGQIQTRLVTAERRFPKPPVDLHTIVADDSGDSEGPTGVLGREKLEEELCGLKWEISPGAFFQTNTEMAERLYAVAAEYAGLSGGERVFDLFCGIGTIGLSMAARAGEVWGLEIVPEAIADAERNAELNGIANARFLAGNARTGVRPLLERAGKPDVVVLDPPRAGLSQKMVRRVLECEAKRIVYVSCNPTTLAPNAAQLVEAGYRLARVRPVDMFPQTPHIECVALFERDESAAAAHLRAAEALKRAGEPGEGAVADAGEASA